MHPDFGEWLRTAHVEPGSDVLERRWTGVEALADDLEARDIPELARLFFSTPVQNSQAEARFRQRFLEADKAFRMKGNTFELATLCGATLVHIFEDESDDPLPLLAALSVATPSFMGFGRKPAVPDIQEKALAILTKRAASLRQRVSVPDADFEYETVKKTIASVQEQLKANQPNPQIADVLTSVLKNLAAGLKAATGAIETFAAERLLFREHADVLWWMTSGYSRDFELPMAKLRHRGAPIIAGKELADLTRVLPGPYAAPAVLRHVVSKVAGAKNPSLAEIVNSTDAEWRTAWVEGLDDLKTLEDLCPVICAVHKSTENPNKKAWLPALRKASGVDGNVVVPFPELAVQTFRECVFFRALSATGDRDGE